MYLDNQCNSDFTIQEMKEVLHVMEHATCRLLSKFTFEKETEAFAIEN